MRYLGITVSISSTIRYRLLSKTHATCSAARVYPFEVCSRRVGFVPHTLCVLQKIMPEHDILGQLGVRIPDATRLPSHRANGGNLVVFAPKAKPPRAPASNVAAAPSNKVSSGPPPQHVFQRTQAPKSTTAMAAGNQGSWRPSSEVSAASPNVPVAPVPCNDWINLQAAERKRQLAAQLRDQERRMAHEERAFAEESRAPTTQADKLALRSELDHAVEARKAELRAQRELAARDERNQLAFLERAAEQEEARRKDAREHAHELRDYLQHQAEQAAANRRSRSQQALYADATDTGLQIGAGDRRATRSQSTDMRAFWVRQIEERREKAVQERERDRAFANEANLYSDRLAAKDAQDAALARAAAKANLDKVHEHQQQAARQRAESRQREQNEAQSEAMRVATQELAQMHARAARQQQLRDEISGMIAARRRTAEERRRLESATEHQANLMRSNPVDHVTRYRCPATGRVLPAAAFNIPRTTWQSPSVTAFL
jgi:hypothetical protein